MQHKSTWPIQNLLIGLKIIAIFVAINCLTGCFSRNYDYYYQVWLKNDTNDTLLMVLGRENVDYYCDSLSIPPLQEITYEDLGSTGVYRCDDIVLKIFSGGYASLEEQVRIYRNDSLMVTWYGPIRKMTDSTHHFYNYYSWETQLIDEEMGAIKFTITEEDFVKE